MTALGLLTIVLLIAWGTLVALDLVSVPQAMLSRPLVSLAQDLPAFSPLESSILILGQVEVGLSSKSSLISGGTRVLPMHSHADDHRRFHQSCYSPARECRSVPKKRSLLLRRFPNTENSFQFRSLGIWMLKGTMPAIMRTNGVPHPYRFIGSSAHQNAMFRRSSVFPR